MHMSEQEGDVAACCVALWKAPEESTVAVHHLNSRYLMLSLARTAGSRHGYCALLLDSTPCSMCAGRPSSRWNRERVGPGRQPAHLWVGGVRDEDGEAHVLATLRGADVPSHRAVRVGGLRPGSKTIATFPTSIIGSGHAACVMAKSCSTGTSIDLPTLLVEGNVHAY